MINITDPLAINALIRTCESKFNKYKKNSETLPFKTHFITVRSTWVDKEHITVQDIDFLEHCANTPIAELKHKAYIMGKWYATEPYGHTYYNLTNQNRSKIVKKCKPLKRMA